MYLPVPPRHKIDPWPSAARGRGTHRRPGLQEHHARSTTSGAATAAAVGGLKLFEPKTMCPLIAVRDREER